MSESFENDWEVVVADTETNYYTTVMNEKTYNDETMRKKILQKYCSDNDLEPHPTHERNPALPSVLHIPADDREDALVIIGEHYTSFSPFELFPVKVQVWKRRKLALLPTKRIIEVYDSKGQMKLFDFQLVSDTTADVVKVTKNKTPFKGRKHVLKLIGGTLRDSKTSSECDDSLIIAYDCDKDREIWQQKLALIF